MLCRQTGNALKPITDLASIRLGMPAQVRRMGIPSLSWTRVFSFTKNYAIKYAYMPQNQQTIHPLMRALPAALRARMDALGHTQMQVYEETGVPQPQISRALTGTRKRLTPSMLTLCRYALLDPDKVSTTSAAVSDLMGLIQHLVGDSAPAAAHMKALLRSLAPLMAEYRNSTAG